MNLPSSLHRRALRWGRLAVLTLALAPQLAVAGTVEAAEHVRLSEEMRKLASRGNWSAVEDQFKDLEGLTAKGETLTVTDYELGAKAARTLGNIGAAKARLEAGAQAGGSKEIIRSIEEIDATFGPARITVDTKYIGDRVLAATTPLMLPEEFSAVSYANSVLVTNSFEGLLPKGSYTVGGKPFDVTPGGTANPVVLAPEKGAGKARPFSLEWAGPRVNVGGSWTAAGDVAPGSLTTEGGVQAAAFGGPGARAGLGVDVGLSKHIGVLGMVGYQGLFGSSDAGAESLHLGYGWLAASARFGAVSLAVGPTWGIGAANVAGVDADCVGGACGNVGGLTTDNAAEQRLSGTLTAGGGTASAGVSLFDLGGLRGGVELSGGALSDSFRWYPWGELGFSLVPASRRD